MRRGPKTNTTNCNFFYNERKKTIPIKLRHIPWYLGYALADCMQVVIASALGGWQVVVPTYPPRPKATCPLQPCTISRYLGVQIMSGLTQTTAILHGNTLQLVSNSIVYFTQAHHQCIYNTLTHTLIRLCVIYLLNVFFRKLIHSLCPCLYIYYSLFKAYHYLFFYLKKYF